MRTELPRQLVHLSGLLFVLLSIYMGRAPTAALFLSLALFFLAYSLYIRAGRSTPGQLIHKIEYAFRRLFMRFERETDRPFLGAFWFYFSLFLVFLLFPMDAALLAGLILSVGDALATMAGKPLGRHEILPGKSLEGSAAFLAGSLVVCLFFTAPHLALAASLGGLLGELLPGLPSLRALAGRGILNDNLTTPTLAGLAAWLLMLA
jgi:dolichol kinase